MVAILKPMRCILVGNFGVGNLGDEAICDAIVAAHPHVSWTVLSASPGDGRLPRLPCGVRSLFAWWPTTVRAYMRSDAVVFGGGTLFTDTESLYACILWWWHAWVAWLLRKPVLLSFQGIGPWRTKMGRALSAWVLKRAAFISVRDPLSARRLTELSINNFVQTFDPVFPLIKEQNKTNGVQKVLILIPRPQSGPEFLSAVLKVMQQDTYHTVRILSMQPSDKGEEAAITSLFDCLARRGIGAEIMPVYSLRVLAQRLDEADMVVTHRFHGAVTAHALSVPFVAVTQAQDDKHATLSVLPAREELLRLVEAGHASLRDALDAVLSVRNKGKSSVS